MADAKTPYSSTSAIYVTSAINNSNTEQDRYNRSKAREKKFNSNWSKQKVNINDVVNQFTPNCTGKAHGVKYEFENDRYVIKADMASGYLRIYDKTLKSYVKLDGSPSKNRDETHFKIKKREEM